ncbi:MAG: DUF4340 domain-containing protein [Pseudomonadota bacterium]
MSAARQDSYIRTLKWLGGACLTVWALVLMGAVFGGRSDPQQHSRLAEPVLERFAEQRRTAQMVRFTLADDDYSLFRTATGWVMPEAGSFPTRRDRIADLMSGFETLTYDARRTADPYKLDLLGLGDPLQDGNGVLVEFLTADGSPLYSLIVGRRDELIYVRAPESNQAYRVAGTLPPFYNRRGWLDFDILTVTPEAIRSVRVRDRSGASVYLRRSPGETARSFRPAPPYQDMRIRNRLTVSTTALAITNFTPTDAKPEAELETRSIARHITETFDGLEIDLRVFNEDDGYWVTLRAVEAGEGARRAQAINEKAEGWAFAIPNIDRRDFMPRVSQLVRNPPPPEPDLAEIDAEGADRESVVDILPAPLSITETD